MIALPFARGQRYAVMGLDKSGLPAVKALLAAGAQVSAWDDNPAQLTIAQSLGAQIEDLSSVDPRHYTGLVLTPGIPHRLPKPHPVATNFKDCPILCDIELFAQTQPVARIVGITGTDGKSTTTALIGHILKNAGVPCAVGGNFGTSPLDLPDLPRTGVYVLELSSYQLERCPSLAVDIGILLNLTPDHLDRHGDMAGYAAAKANLFKTHKPGAMAIYGTEDHYTQGIGEAARHRGWTGVALTIADTHRGLNLLSLPTLQGAHNRQNAIAAIETCVALGLGLSAIEAGLMDFPGLPHRQQYVAQLENIAFINDSKATNANAASKALGCFDNIYWIAGGQPKTGGLTGLESYIPRIRQAFLIGQAEDEFASWCAQNNLGHQRCGTLEQAVAAAVSAARRDNPANAVILLSPACASWDQFKSYEHRGQTFIALAQAHAQEAKQA